MGDSGKIKKILFHSELREWGGSEELWFRAARIALYEGYIVGIYTQKGMLPQSKLEELQQYPNATFFYGKPSPFIIRIISRILRILSPKYHFYYHFDDFNEDAIEWQPDLVVFSHGHNLATEPIIPRFRKNNIKYCTVAQAAVDQMSPDDDFIPFIKENFKFSEGNYFVSRANLELTRLQMGGEVPNSKVVSNPFNVPYNSELEYPDDKIFKLACVGRYDFGPKGQDILLKVLSLPKWKDRNIEINLYGKGPNENCIRDLIRYFDLENVFIRGFYPTIDIWRENHALILPSRYEGLPLAVVEAMLCGRFAITTNVSGNTEVIIDNENGFIAEAPQIEYLDRAMERAWERRSEWQNIGKNAKEYIKTLVPESPEDIFYKELISKL